MTMSVKNRTVQIFAAIIIALLLSGCARAPVFVTEHSDAPETVTFAPVPTEAPTPIPTPEPESVILLSQDAENPLPKPGERLLLGKGYPLRGVITSNYPITSVRAMAFRAYSEDPLYPYERIVTFSETEPVYSYALDGENTLEGVSLDSLVRFSDFLTGHNYFGVYVTTTRQREPFLLYETDFLVLSDKWERIKKSDFNGSYEQAYDFFKGQKDHFLYRYQRVWQRYNIADPDWEAEFIVGIPGYADDVWHVHKDAVPYYEKAFSFVESTRVRVHGANGDSGVLPLSALITEYNGSYLARFTSSMRTISHHAFGTATDLNASMLPNKNTKENKQLIDDEVRKNLSYNGIVNDGAQPYYDFTYAGSYPATANGVPDSVVNYLLYELAFYRAGFLWGHNYVSTSDGMHFTLSDNVRVPFDGKEGLRKVFFYAEELS